MTSYVTPKKNSAFIQYIGLASTAAGGFQTNPTIAAGDIQISKDGGAFANPATLPVVTPAGGKAVKISLSAAEMNADNIVILCSDAAGNEWQDVLHTLQTSAQQMDDLASQTSVTAIKTQTDKFTFTVANHADINIKYIHDVEITGSGVEETDEWRPV